MIQERTFPSAPLRHFLILARFQKERCFISGPPLSITISPSFGMTEDFCIQRFNGRRDWRYSCENFFQNSFESFVLRIHWLSNESWNASMSRPSGHWDKSLAKAKWFGVNMLCSPEPSSSYIGKRGRELQTRIDWAIKFLASSYCSMACLLWMLRNVRLHC